MKKIRIGQIGPLNLSVPPKKYGGTEKIIDWLCSGLVKRGHHVTLFAARDSKTDAHLCPIIEKSLWTFKHKEDAPYYAYEMAVVAREVKKLKLDILHDHLGPWSLSLYGQVNIPIVHTLHVPLNVDRAWAYSKLKSKLISISDNQRKIAPNLNYAATIYNGTDIEIFKFNSRHQNYLAFVGELSVRKGIWEAIEVAKALKMKLVIAGRIPTMNQKRDFEFFEEYIKPEFKRKNIIYVGEKTPKGVARVYRGALATLFPIRWEEPFGLVMVESMSCGTPVIAFRRGSVPEVIKDGKTGFIVGDVFEMADAVKKIDIIDRRYCRRHVEDNFGVDAMIDNYERVFRELTK